MEEDAEVDASISGAGAQGAPKMMRSTMTADDGSSGTLADAKQDARLTFQKKLRRHFDDLTARGVSPNDAAALALKIASGAAEPPLDLIQFLASVDDAKCSGEYGDLNATIGKVFSSADALNSSFLLDPGREVEGSGDPCETVSIGTSNSLGIDFKGVRRAYEAITSTGSMDTVDALMRACETLLNSLLNATAWPTVGSGILRQLLILLENPVLMDPEHHSVLEKLTRVVTSLEATMQHGLVLAFMEYSKEQFPRLVNVVQQFITIHLYESQQIDEAIESSTRFLGLLNAANEKAGIVSFTEFYNDAVNNEDFNIREDYRRWKQPERYEFSFCKFPFIYDPSSKARILQLENNREQFHEFEDAVFRSIFIGATCPYLVLKVRRGEHLIQDTLYQIHRQAAADGLKKPLKVHFVGEEGVDEGGVQKEFFLLLLRDIFDPNYGMFSYDEDTRLFWFKPSSLDLEMEYELIGIVLGLAIYNSHILEFSFPMVTYRKLLGSKATFEDLKEVAPAVASGLQKLLDYGEGDVEDVFGLCFQVEYDAGFGEGVRTADLRPDGGDVRVTRANKEEYVRLYTGWYLERSVERQFGAFARGFHRLCSGPALALFKPEELEQLICGSEELDFDALENHTLYDDGYVKESESIRLFWKVAHSLSDEDKKKLLFFATGSDRVPIKGLGNLNPSFVVSRNGPCSERLPTAHTCFNHLLLPEYSSEDIMTARVMTAINNAEGFGLM